MTTAISQSTDHAALLRLEKQYKGFGYSTKVEPGPKVGKKPSWRLYVTNRKNRARRRNAGTSSKTATRTATSTKATTTGNKTGTSTGGAVSGGGGNITVSVKRNPPKGFIRCSGVKITRKNGRTEVRIRK